jgi:hypothetical protein
MNKALLLSFFFLGLVIASHVSYAQPEDDTQLELEIMEMEDLQGDDGVVIDPNFLSGDIVSYDNYNKVVIRILDKITADTRTYDLTIGKTVAYGSLRMRPMACRKTPPIEEPESASFLQIWEKIPDSQDAWVFSGWMFASSPSLSSMEHPVYDVWVIDCKD